MANIIDQVGGTLGEFGWASMGNITLVIAIFVFIIIFIGIIILFTWWKSFNISVRIYEPLGQIPLDDEDLGKVKGQTSKERKEFLNKKTICFDNVSFKKTHGKHLKSKGTPYFQTFFPLKKHEPIPMEFMYDNGVHLLRLSRDLFIPLYKPKTIVKIGEEVSISVSDHNRWVLFNNLMADRINNRYQDVDLQKKITLYFVTGIVVMVLIGGFILWLIYSSINKGMDVYSTLGTLMGGGPK